MSSELVHTDGDGPGGVLDPSHLRSERLVTLCIRPWSTTAGQHYWHIMGAMCQNSMDEKFNVIHR